MTDRRLIEEELPLKEVNAESAREKSLRHGHISTMHLWWARRPLAMSRAVVFGTLLPDPGDEAKRKEILKLLARRVPLRGLDKPGAHRSTPRSCSPRLTRTARPRSSTVSLAAAPSRSKRCGSAATPQPSTSTPSPT